MNLDLINKWLSLLANVGVIVGIIFLSIEISQNNLLLESEARMNQADNIVENWEEIYRNPELAALLAKISRGDELSGAETIQLEAFQYARILGMQFQYEQLRSGALDQVNLPAWREIYNGNTTSPPLIEAWERVRDRMRPEFRDFFEANVVNQ